MANWPLIYVEVDDVRPDESQGQENAAVIFTTGALSVPSELNSRVFKFLSGNDLLSVAHVSEVSKLVVWDNKALLFDAVRAQIDNVISVMYPETPSRRRQVNNHGFKKKNRVEVRRGRELLNGHVVGVTSKHILFVCYDNIFDVRPLCVRIESERGVVHVRPYIGDVVERVRNWRL